MDVPTTGGGPACEQGTTINAEAGSATVVPGSGASAMDVPTAGGGPACEQGAPLMPRLVQPLWCQVQGHRLWMCLPLVVAPHVQGTTINAEAGSATVVPGSGASAMDVPTAGGGPACEQGTTINAEAGSATVVSGSGALAMDVPTAGGGPACEQGATINAEAGSATVVSGSGASAMDVPTAGGGH